MRGSKAKSLRRERPDRPNPGRKFGGNLKEQVDRQAGLKSRIRKAIEKQKQDG
jgi:hypothetical protein